MWWTQSLMPLSSAIGQPLDHASINLSVILGYFRARTYSHPHMFGTK